MKTLFYTVLLYLMTTYNILADHNFKTRPDSHAPIGLMGDHLHLSNEFMISYRYMEMNMKDLINNGKDITNSSSLSLTNSKTGQTYRILPKNMKMKMHNKLKNIIAILYAIILIFLLSFSSIR